MNERFAGRFLLLRRLGQGGMGEVFLARDTSTGVERALKRLHLMDAGVVDSVRNEFEALSRVRHPAVVGVYEFGVSGDGVPFYTMEYVPGLPADHAIAPDDWPALFFVAARVAHGLEVLHAANVIHGDLKPSNLLVVPGERAGSPPRSVRLLDFGLATLIGKTGEGHVGTPGFAAPEVVAGTTPTVASDLYGLGATLFAIATRRQPFAGDDRHAILRSQRAGPPSGAPLEAAGMPPALVRLVLSLMASEPAERPRDAREVRRELERAHPAARSPLEDRIQAVLVVGRERELARIEAWARRPVVRPPLMLLTGTAGAGKSGLLAELATRAALSERPVVLLSAASLEGPGAIAAALARRMAAEAAADVDHEFAARIAGDGLAERDLDAVAVAAAEWAATIARRSKALLVLLDDAERLDDRSQAWIRRLISMPEPAPIAWIWASRPGEASDGEQVLTGAGLAERIELGPLDRAGLSALAATRLNALVPPVLEEFLWVRSGGHAGLAVELLRRAALAKAVVEDDVVLRVDESALAGVRPPEDYESGLAQRLASLTPEARQLAEALAVWGFALDPALARSLAPEADPGVVEGLVTAGLATRLPTGEIQLWPPLLAERVAADLSAERRRALHRSALEIPRLSRVQRFRHLRGAGDARAALEEARMALAEAPWPGLAEEAAAVAEAQVPERAVEWHDIAGRELMERRRFVEAIPHLRAALEREPASTHRAERWALLCRALLRSADYQAVFRLVEEASREALPAGAMARLLADEASARFGAGQPQAGRARALEAVPLAEATGEADAEGFAAQALAYGARDAGQISDCAAWTRRAVDAFARAGRPGYSRATALQVALAWAQRRPEEAERLCLEAIRAAQQARDRLAVEELGIGLAPIQVQLGRWQAAIDTCETSMRIGLEDARPMFVASAAAGVSMMLGLTGRPRAARRIAHTAIRLSRQYRPRMESSAWRALAQAERQLGLLERAGRAIARGLSTAPPDYRAGSNLLAIEQAKILGARGKWAEVAQVTNSVLLHEQGEMNVDTAFLLIQAGRAELRTSSVERAEARLEALERWLAMNAAPYARAQALQLGAEIAFARQRFEEGFQLGQKALDAYAALPAPPDRAAAALDLALLAGNGPDPNAQGIRWLELAAATFERVGDRRGRERALAGLVERLKRSELPTGSAGGELSLIERVSWLLNSITDLKELTQRAMRMAVDQLEAERGVLLLHERETGEMRVMAEHGAVDAAVRGAAVRFSRRVVQRVTESGGALLIQDAHSDPRASDSMRGLGLQSIVCVPLFLGGAVMGAVYLDDSRRAHLFGEAERGLLEGFAHLISVAIEKARGHEEIERMRERLEGENLSLRKEVGGRFQFQNLIGTSSEIQRVMAMIQPASRVGSTVLITGENGTGKELVARILHHSGPRRKGPFVSVNCGAIPESLVESELFGILANVATNVRARDGRFVQADGGTLFLDEIGEMPPSQQVALLAAIANREVTPVGGSRPIPVDVRIVAATNRRLRQLVEEQRFREDLYYRLAVIEIEMPPLRERKSDIPALARHFVQHFAAVQQREVPKLSPDFMAVLMQSDWPGNVRALQNYIERVLAMNPGPTLRPEPPPRDLQERAAAPRHSRGRGLIATVGEVERRMVAEALQRAGGNQSKAARSLGLTEQSLRYRLRKYGLVPRENRRIR